MDICIGMGEVGTALYNVLVPYYKIHCMDRKEKYYSILESVNVMHICFPYSEDFVKEVWEYRKQFFPNLVIIHSTVPVGTTRKCGIGCIHSPIEGIHPHLEKSLLTFKKWIGGASKINLKMTKDYFKKAGIKTRYGGEPEQTELAKLLSTGFRYPTHIMLAQEQERICKKFDLDYDEVVIKYDKDYNIGYKKLGLSKYTRPLLFPGTLNRSHCIIPNMKMLKRSIKSKLFRLINKSNWKKLNGK